MHDFRYAGRQLHCEDVSIEALVEKHGTPLYVYSQHTLEDHYRKLDTALAPLDHLICYAMKANSNLAVIRTFANLGSGFDIGERGRAAARDCGGRRSEEVRFRRRGQDRGGNCLCPPEGDLLLQRGE